MVCLNYVLLQRGTRVVYLWIPAHRDGPGNDTADALARLSTIIGPSPTDVLYEKSLDQIKSVRIHLINIKSLLATVE